MHSAPGFMRKLTRLVLPVPVRTFLRKLPLSLAVALSSNYLIAYWWDDPQVRNFGDVLNLPLIAALSGRKVVHPRRLVNLAGKPVYHVIGSVLRRVRSERAVVWGSGFIDSRDGMTARPGKVFAVRGPLTRRRLLELGVECPEVYGDPALLCPRLFPPSPVKRYRLGIVPHWTERDSPLLASLRERPDVRVVDVLLDVDDVVRQITECEAIASSSLHGLIVADAYGVPAAWVKMSGDTGGDDFKFHDYFLAVGRRNAVPVQLGSDTTPEQLLKAASGPGPHIDTDKLLAACPFAEKRSL